MIVGCYTMDLYCDAENKDHGWNAFPDQFFGRNEMECITQAKKKGWKFKPGRNPREAFCPDCVKSGMAVASRRID